MKAVWPSVRFVHVRREAAEDGALDVWPDGATWAVHESGALTIRLDGEDLGGYADGTWAYVHYVKPAEGAS